MKATILYKYVKEFSEMKFNDELRREDSLIRQSGQMQFGFFHDSNSFHGYSSDN